LTRYTDPNLLPELHASSVALGFFDGVHLGHAAVLQAADPALTPVVCTFSMDNAPVRKSSTPLLCTSDDRAARLAALGTKVLVELPFSAVSDWSAEQFVDFLQQRLGAKELLCGYNFRFGHNAVADADRLFRLCGERGIGCKVLPPLCVQGQPVSSSAIRALLSEGNTEQAARLLGRPYSFAFPVVSGRQLGRQWNFPTINQHLPGSFVKPLFGVYASTVLLHGKRMRGVTNLGIKPTVGSDGVLAETYILDCDEDLYGLTLEVQLHRFLRREQKFADIALLRAQIAKDVEAARTAPLIGQDTL